MPSSPPQPTFSYNKNSKIQMNQADLNITLNETPYTDDLGVQHLCSVLREAVDQVVRGKGDERHGDGKPLYDQPWNSIATAVGEGFLIGQAMKKASEAGSMMRRGLFTGVQYERELLGAINYLAFAVMHKRESDAKDAH